MFTFTIEECHHTALMCANFWGLYSKVSWLWGINRKNDQKVHDVLWRVFLEEVNVQHSCAFIQKASPTMPRYRPDNSNATAIRITKDTVTETTQRDHFVVPFEDPTETITEEVQWLQDTVMKSARGACHSHTRTTSSLEYLSFPFTLTKL